MWEIEVPLKAKSKAKAPIDSKTFGFLKLPVEIKILIFQLLRFRCVNSPPRLLHTFNVPSFIRATKALLQDCLPIFLDLNKFRLYAKMSYTMSTDGGYYISTHDNRFKQAGRLNLPKHIHDLSRIAGPDTFRNKNLEF